MKGGSHLVSRQAPDEAGRTTHVVAGRPGWEYIGFDVISLAGDGELPVTVGAERELCLVVLEGIVRVRCGAAGKWREVGGRATVFDGPAHAMYVPPGTPVLVRGTGAPATLAACTAPARSGPTGARHIRPDDNPEEIRGEGPMRRTVRPILMGNQPADSLLVVEVMTPEGLWSSFPPHKHDVDDPPRERRLEETYYHRMRPTGDVPVANASALQGMYLPGGEAVDPSLGSWFTVRDGDTVLVPRGYHPVSAVPGYDLYYLNVMAGPVREWLVTIDPDHAWISPPPTDLSVTRTADNPRR